MVEVDRPEFLSFDSFSRDLGTLADTQKKQIYQLRLQTNASKALLRKYEAFSLFKLFEEKMESMGTTSETMNTINSMSTIESIMDYDLPKSMMQSQTFSVVNRLSCVTIFRKSLI